MKINGEDLSSIEKNANEIEYYNSLTKIFKKIFILLVDIKYFTMDFKGENG